MSDDEEMYALTEKGARLALEVYERFTAGEDIEQIAASYALEVEHVQILILFATHAGVLD